MTMPKMREIKSKLMMDKDLEFQSYTQLWRITFARELTLQERSMAYKLKFFYAATKDIRVRYNPSTLTKPISLICSAKTARNAIDWLLYEAYRIVYHFGSFPNTPYTKVAYHINKLAENKYELKMYLQNDKGEQFGAEIMQP